MTTESVNLARQLVANRHIKFYKEMMTTEFKMPEPVYQMQIMPEGRWVDHSKLMHEWAKEETVAPLRVVYTSSDMRAVIEQCAQIAHGAYGPEEALHETRKLLEQVK